jgi:hypothetical protein
MTPKPSQHLTYGQWQNPIDLISQYSQSFTKHGYSLKKSSYNGIIS